MIIYNPDDISYHGKRVQHVRTKAIRIIYVLVGSQTPSAEVKNGYSPITNILYDTFVVNNQFYNLLD